MAIDGHTDVAARDFASIIRRDLRNFMWVRSVDAMEWVLKCAIGDMDFDQTVENEIPILRRYYNEFLSPSEWSDQDHTMMTVLNKYDEIKAKGYGNFTPDAPAQTPLDP